MVLDIINVLVHQLLHIGFIPSIQLHRKSCHKYFFTYTKGVYKQKEQQREQRFFTSPCCHLGLSSLKSEIVNSISSPAWAVGSNHQSHCLMPSRVLHSQINGSKIKAGSNTSNQTLRWGVPNDILTAPNACHHSVTMNKALLT